MVDNKLRIIRDHAADEIRFHHLKAQTNLTATEFYESLIDEMQDAYGVPRELVEAAIKRGQKDCIKGLVHDFYKQTFGAIWTAGRKGAE